MSLPSQLCCVSLSVLLLLPCPSHNNWQEIALISPPRLLLDEKSFNGNMNIQKMRYIHLCICIYMQLVLIFLYEPLFHLHLPVNPGSRSSTALNLNPPQWVCTSGLEPHSSGRGGLGPLLAPSSVFTSGLQPQFPPTSCCFVQPPPAFIPPALIIQIYPHPN